MQDCKAAQKQSNASPIARVGETTHCYESVVTSPTLIKSPLSVFDASVHHCLQSVWPSIIHHKVLVGSKPAYIVCLSRGGLGLRSVAVHSTAAYLHVGSITSSSPDLLSSHYVIEATCINNFNL